MVTTRAAAKGGKAPTSPMKKTAPTKKPAAASKITKPRSKAAKTKNASKKAVGKGVTAEAEALRDAVTTPPRPSTGQEKTPTGLLTLPPEMRLLIYGEALKSDPPNLDAGMPEFFERLGIEIKGPGHFDVGRRDRERGEDKVPPLLQASRLIRNEALPEFFALNDLWFTSHDFGRMTGWLPNIVPRDMVKHLKSVNLDATHGLSHYLIEPHNTIEESQAVDLAVLLTVLDMGLLGKESFG